MLNDADSGILGILNTLLGGSFSRASIFGLGIMPYISASIVIQLMTVAVPSFQKMQKEGESGRKKLTQITRVLTILVTLAQSVGYLRVTIPSEAISPNIDPTFFMISSMVLLTSGTMFCMWLGEKITDKGIGNGISMLIMIGIISSLPGAAWYEFVTTNGLSRALFSVVEILVLFGVVIVTVALVQAVRRIPVQYAKQVVGGKVYGGQRQFIPLKVNAAGVMPIIFAQALMILPTLIGQIWQEESDLALRVANVFSNPYSWQYTVVFAILIIAFTFFYTAITVNPSSMADDLKRNGGFIPGIKPGRPTSEFIGSVLDKITLPGSIFLAIIAILPTFAYNAGVGQQFSYFYGGTSLLIMVGVILDTLQQIESYLLMRHYEGMMKSGKMRGRSQNMAVA
jgi:preprotein translocase subunit SecY